MYKKMIAVVPILVVLLAISSFHTPAVASEPPARDVPSEEEFAPYWEEAARMPIMSDKGPMRRLGTYPTRKGVILVTGDKFKWIPSGHAAIVYSSSRVVESTDQGVVFGSNNWASSKGVVYGLNVNETTTIQDAAAANWCYSQIGKPYNYNFFDRDTRISFYCSQLVWAAYKDLYGIDLDTPAWGNAVYPTELVMSSHTSTLYSQV